MNRIALLFPGQGSQFVGMGKSLYDTFPAAREIYHQANEILGFNIMEICFEGGLLELHKTENLFLSIVITSVAAYKVYMTEIGIDPVAGAGHSLGEYSALICSGMLPFDDGLKIIRERGRLARELAESGTGSMSIVNNIDHSLVEKECEALSGEKARVSIACYNSLHQVTVAGEKELMYTLEDRLFDRGVQITPLLTSAPFHCYMMETLVPEFSNLLDPVEFQKGNWPVISNVTASPYSSPGEIKGGLIRQLTEPVRWSGSLAAIPGNDVDCFIEVGPQAVLTEMLKDNHIQKPAFPFGTAKNVDETKTALLHTREDGPGFIDSCLAAAVSTPNANWDEESYRQGVIVPYEQLEALQLELEDTGKHPTREQKEYALDLLKQIVRAKKVSPEWMERKYGPLAGRVK